MPPLQTLLQLQERDRRRHRRRRAVPNNKREAPARLTREEFERQAAALKAELAFHKVQGQRDGDWPPPQMESARLNQQMLKEVLPKYTTPLANPLKNWQIVGQPEWKGEWALHEAADLPLLVAAAAAGDADLQFDEQFEDACMEAGSLAEASLERVRSKRRSRRTAARSAWIRWRLWIGAAQHRQSWKRPGCSGCRGSGSARPPTSAAGGRRTGRGRQ